MISRPSLKRAGLVLVKLAVAATLLGAYHRVAMLYPLPESLGLRAGLAALVVGAMALASMLTWLFGESLTVPLAALIGLPVAATHVELRTTDTSIGLHLAAMQALQHWTWFLGILLAAIALASWLTSLARRRSDRHGTP